MYVKAETIVGAFILLATALFFYMSFQIGSFRLDLARYAHYSVGIKDVAGLAPKADIKIAGVKVGWVDAIRLLPRDNTVELSLKILKEYVLYKNAQAIVRQEGMVGVKFLEIIPGNLEATRIEPGGALVYQKRQFVGMDETFYTIQKVAAQIEEFNTALKNAAHEARGLFADLKKTVEPLNALLSQLSSATGTITTSLEQSIGSIKQAADGVNRIIGVADVPVKHIGEFAQKLNTGQGSLGKLLSDESMYDDIKSTAQYAKNCIQRVGGLAFAVDSHFEILPRSRGERERTNIKWYFDARFYPCRELFAQLGLVYSHQGFARRVSALCNDKYLSCIEGKRDAFRLNLQLGTWFHKGLGLRAGIFEGTAGLAADVCLPFERVRWLTTFEAFDFKGHNRFDRDCRPHLKWINRVFFNPYLYLNFGADDFISRCNKSGFIGVGAFFSTSDLWKS